ncbi:hemophore-related protein [Mycobacterium bourgelatii]|uniref:hemophore-related protein n=1 Tax=Mycobacterium bourgelatii TaxID=1273442 RepID=UPI0013D0C515|nr:hemophore-related protein [Mycobacterium bourgelatii]MCV6974919.1 hemophore-related protein [Mycobacterium bourgelatii]
MRLSKTLAAGVGGLALSLTVGAGIASADPIEDAINTTCNYGQVIAALNATDPAAAAQLQASPIARAKVSEFLSSGPAGRRAILTQLSAYPGAQQYVNDLGIVAGSCNNY